MESETFSVLVENNFGVLTRVAGLFSGRGYNIDSLTVSPTQNDAYSRMTIVTHGDDDILEQIEKQLNKLVEVVKVTRLNRGEFVARELMLIKIRVTAANRSEVMQVVSTYDAHVVAMVPDALVIELTDITPKLDEFATLMQSYGVIELARTGNVALARSAQATEMP